VSHTFVRIRLRDTRPVADENVEAIRRGFEAYNRKDVPAFQEIWHEDATIQTFLGGTAEATTFRGHAGIKRWIEGEGETWEMIRVEDLEFRAAPPDRVVVLGRLVARGRGSGIELDASLAWVIQLRDRRGAAMRTYFNRDEALLAAGLATPG
jgi:ketosteroid isomerase-like protein